MDKLADFLVLLAGLFLYGVKGFVGRWLVTVFCELLKKLYVETEHEFAAFMEGYHEVLKK